MNPIDLNDYEVQQCLLGRRPAALLTATDCQAYAGRRLLVTGAGGSVGSELARQLAACGPRWLTLVDQSEYQLFRIGRELAERWPELAVEAVLADVTAERLIERACQIGRPDVVFHAAAYKHVTMLERAVCSAVQANVVGTIATARAAREVGADFVLVSTDKAAGPRSVMGATKRAAELVALMLASVAFRTITVRFGNILGSSGSVVETWLACLRRGRPLPVTDLEATRYFMTGSEAASLLLKANLVAGSGDTCWLDMGRSVPIIDLARRLAARATPGVEPRFEVIGLRAGEKRREELADQWLDLKPTSDPRILVASPGVLSHDALRSRLQELLVNSQRHDALGTLADLKALVPEFQPSEAAWAAAALETSGASVASTPTGEVRLIA